jgi:hypothetical protein
MRKVLLDEGPWPVKVQIAANPGNPLAAIADAGFGRVMMRSFHAPRERAFVLPGAGTMNRRA